MNPFYRMTRPLLTVMETSVFTKASEDLNLDLHFNLKSGDAVRTLRARPSHRALCLAQHRPLLLLIWDPPNPLRDEKKLL